MIQSPYNTKMKISSAMIFSISLGMSCAKQREPKLTETPDAKIFAIADFGDGNPQSPVASLQLSTNSLENCKNPGIGANCELPNFTVNTENMDIPAKMAYMFQDLQIAGTAGQIIRIVFSVNDQYVEAFKVISSSNAKATELEKGTALNLTQLNLLKSVQVGTYVKGDFRKEFAVAEKSKTEQPMLIPLFKYKVKAKGILERKKNANGEETAEIALTPTDFKNAQYVQIDTGIDSRLSAPYFDAEGEAQADSILVASKLQNKIFTSNELTSVLGVDGTQSPQSCSQSPLTTFLTQVDKATSSLKVYGVVYGCSSTSTAATTPPTATAAPATPVPPTPATVVVTATVSPSLSTSTPTLIDCPKVMQKSAETEIKPGNCQMLDLNLKLPISFVRAELPMQKGGKRADNIKFAPVDIKDVKDNSGLIKMAPAPAPAQPQASAATN